MAIYLDSANLDEARQAGDFGWVRGVTTNPYLMAKTGEEPEDVLAGLAELGFQQIFYQLVSQNLDDMLMEAREACEIVREGLVLKVVPTVVGYRFVADHGNEFPCCVTAVFAGNQALIAHEVGAQYVAVYVNRATKQMGDGPALVREVAQALGGSRTEILAASLKSTQQAMNALTAGAHHITIPFDLLRTLSSHPLSARTVEQFNTEGTGIQLRR